MTQVSQVMTRGVHTLPPHETIVKAAQAMGELDVGAIPVCDGDRLVGMVTDRDIVLRGVAQGLPADQTALSEVMSPDVNCCFDDDAVDEVAGKMRDAQIRRMPVINHQQQLVGMLSLGDIAVKADADTAGAALEQISEPAEPDRQARARAHSGPEGGDVTGAV